MPYLNCPRCALAIRLRPGSARLQHCPRCLGRSQLAVPLYVSAMPHRLDAAGGRTDAGGSPRHV